jgi:CBS-domain-containing membrane protein
MDIFSKGIHRVVVMDADNQICGVLTQSNVANFLYGKVCNSTCIPSLTNGSFKPFPPCKKW